MRKNRTPKITAYVFGPFLFASDSQGHIDVTIRIIPEWIDRIIQGFRGLSPEIRIRKWECSICHQNYEDCIHEVGQKYGDEICQQIARDIEPLGGSLVQYPKDPRARITDLLIVEEERGKKRYKWYGFPVITENQRFKHIQSALESGLIPHKVAFHFSKYFSIHLEGKVTYP